MTVFSPGHYFSGNYGGSDLALTLGGDPVAGYHTGYANVPGQLIGARHSHVDNAGYSLDQNPRELSDEDIVDGLIAEEQERDALTWLSICLLARKIYDRRTVLAAPNAIGIAWREEGWVALGWRIYRDEVALKESLGFAYRALRAQRAFSRRPACAAGWSPSGWAACWTCSTSGWRASKRRPERGLDSSRFAFFLQAMHNPA